MGPIYFNNENFENAMNQYESTEADKPALTDKLASAQEEDDCNTCQLLDPSAMFNQKLLGVVYDEKFLNKMREWQINVKILKLRYLISIEENTVYYCNIKIGDREFNTEVKPIENLTFTDVIINQMFLSIEFC